jgi:hypothetical protein
MMIIGADYHPGFQQISFMDQATGECGQRRLNHSDGEVQKFYRALKQPGVRVRVGIEATGYSRWFERLLVELDIEVWIGNAAEITAKRVRKQTDREDARLLLKLLLADLGSAPLTISSISTVGDFRESDTCGNAIAAAASCTMSVVFTPSVSGERTGSIAIADSSAGSPHMIALTGSGAVPGVTLSPASLSFPNQAVGSASPPQTVTLTNDGSGDLLVDRISTTGDFSQTNTCGTDVPSAPNPTASNNVCTISIIFAPTAVGARTGTLSIADNALGSPQAAACSYRGVATLGIDVCQRATTHRGRRSSYATIRMPRRRNAVAPDY